MNTKYNRIIHPSADNDDVQDDVPDGAIVVDVYSVLEAFDVRCPAVQHAVKKLLAPGQRGSKDTLEDLHDAYDSISRAMDIERKRSLTKRK